MTKVLFTHSYFLHFDPKQWKLGKPYAPLATITAASFLRKNGYEVSLWDAMFEKTVVGLEEYINVVKPDYLVVLDDGFNYLTKMCLTNMREAAFEMCRMANIKGIKVVVSGSDAADNAKKYIDAGAHVVVKGEVEITLLELLNSWTNSGFDKNIKGLLFQENENIIFSGPRDLIRDLDTLPLPAWDLVDLKKYKQVWQKSSGYFSVNLVTTRGCPYKCNWCAKPIYGNRYQARSPENVVEEIVYLKSITSFEHIWFCDDIFGLKPGWVKRFADLLDAKSIKVKYKIQSRADLLLQDEQIKDLARSGCDEVWIGAESGSQKVLDAMDKGITVEQIHTSTGLMRKEGIKTALFLQFGYPGEEQEDINKTINMLGQIMPDDLGISVSYPLPGTGFYEKVKSDLVAKSNWKDSNDLDMMFNGTYSSAYYKRLHLFVHQNYRSKQALEELKKLAKLKAANVKKAASFFYFKPASVLQKIRLQSTPI